MSRDKVRIRFRKGGDLRFLSHHDLMRAFERMMRRAALPLRFSEGFHPKPRMVFASALGLGIVGGDEVLEIELEETLAGEEIHRRLAQQCPAGLEILSVLQIDSRRTGQACRATYRFPLLAGEVAETQRRAAELLARADCWVDRTKPQPRKVNVRAYLRSLSVSDGALLIELSVTPTGAARPEEVLHLLDLGDPLQNGRVLERTRLELVDELGTASDAPPDPALSPVAAASIAGPVSQETS